MSKVYVRPSGHTFTVQGDESILDAALRSGYAFPYGCRGGACGACKSKLVAGRVHYGEDEPMALTEEEQAAGEVLLCIARPDGEVTIEVHEVSTAEELQPKRYPAKVARMERLGEVMRLWLKLPEDARMQYLAGQYVEFFMADGRRRAFSIANPPHADDLLEFHIRHIRGGRFTEHVFDEMKTGEIIRIEGPHGSFYLREESECPILLLATGTGFGPVKAIVEHALAEGCTRPIYLYWGARHREDLYLDDLPHGWEKACPNFHYRPVLSRPDPEWKGRVGHVQNAAAEDFADVSGFEVYACGHPDMVFAAKDALTAKGLDPAHCFSDAFSWAKD